MPTKKTGKSMDIQKPDKTAPNSTSRPIIVTNRPILQDPMVVTETESEDKPYEPKPAEQATTALPAKTIEPSKDMRKEVAITAIDETEKTANEVSEPAAKATDSIDPDSLSNSSDAAVVDAVVNATRGSDASEEQKAKDADAKRRQAVQVLVDTKKYMVPIGQVTRARHNRRVSWLIILLGLVLVAYVVADLDLFELPFELPFQIFK